MFELMPFGRREKSMFDYLDNMERQFFGDLPMGFSEFRTDIVDKGDKFVMQAELPGFEKGDIHIDIDGDRLTIRAEHKDDKEEKKDNYVRRERRYGTFSRSFNMTGIDTGAIQAAYTNGVLELELPKKQPKAPESRQIDIQ